MGSLAPHALAGAATNGYTAGMDSVRFGRALGMGARYAAKTLATAADAATAPNPSATRSSEQPGREPAATPARRTGEVLGQKAARTTAQVRQTKKGLSRGGKRLGGAAWGPFVKLSGVLWLEVTGVFFGLFLLIAVINTGKLLTKLHASGLNRVDVRYLFFSIVMALVFGYFCVSSFVRANRRQHRG
jgi:hypothetical protein